MCGHERRPEEDLREDMAPESHGDSAARMKFKDL
jgi:hypothetical protein